MRLRRFVGADLGVIPSLFIVGAPRCGTSSLSRYLDTHPRVYMSKPKEPHYFGSDLDIRPRPYATLEAYLRLFESAGDVRHAGEASVLYLYSGTAPAEILGLSPDARIIIMLRDPVDFVASLHAHNLFAAYEDIQDLGKALEAEADRRQGRRIPPTCIPPICLQYTTLARYAEHVVRYQEAFGPDRVRCILLDDLRADAAKVCDGILGFLGLEGPWRPELKAHNPRRRWRHQGVGRALVSVYRRAGLLGAKVPSKLIQGSIFAAAWALTALPLRLNVVPAQTAPPPPELRRALRQQLRDDVGRLGGLLGRDLSAWSNPDA